MQELLNEELAKSEKVTIDGKEYRLAFPIGAVILYKKLTGESLFNLNSWVKKLPENPDGWDILIGPQDDPEKFLFALYAGIYGGQLISGHRGEPDQLILSGLKATIDLNNARELFHSLLKALVAYIIPSTPRESEANPQTARVN